MNGASIQVTDPGFAKKETYNFIERFFLHFINDERDLPFTWLSLKMTFFVLPIAIYLFLPGCFSWWIAVPYLLLNMGLLMGPFILMLHNTSHNALFKPQYSFMNYYIPWILGPLYGESPETYFGHHIGMHHSENNLSEDLSSTMTYQRDSFKDFMTYFGTFFFFGLADLIRYFKERSRTSFMRRVFFGELSFVILIIALCFFNWQATLMVLILPMIIARFSMMAGNWAQHAFVDANDPANNYRNSITCINCHYNRTCFNDGYHIGHHLRPKRHWTDMPRDFYDNRHKYAANHAVVFEGIDFHGVWFRLMTKNYDSLAAHFVDIDGRFKGNKAQIIAFLKERTRKCV